MAFPRSPANMLGVAKWSFAVEAGEIQQLGAIVGVLVKEGYGLRGVLLNYANADQDHGKVKNLQAFAIAERVAGGS